jgi:hypothetical protein
MEMMDNYPIHLEEARVPRLGIMERVLARSLSLRKIYSISSNITLQPK